MDKKQINDLVAENIMGFVRARNYGQEGWGTPDNYRWFSHFNPSGDIADAWQVVEKLQENRNVNVGTANLYSKTEGKARKVDKYYCEIYGEKTYLEYEKSAPMVICKTALKTVGIEID